MIHVIARVVALPEHQAQVEAELRTMVAATRQEPGNLCYDLFADLDGGAGFSLFETYADQAALEAHRDSAHFQAYRSRISGWLATPPEVQVLRALDQAQKPRA
ncbi:antibiotic biosynthesis monooxygenase [Pseudomonas sp. FFUP_PS_473]|jgi:quinol monooxygenase YgiN|uniref:putative quinol monooxygenase n=1 Tax=Pseudomonas TaxID=286 RepID=UPI000C7CBB00|nr:putative quinol monooxygenase [Pseudomonas sp. FFUP_PS_473]MEE3635806.1 putative quinol monooxygenase [Pseudomonas sp. AL 58]PLP96080.1 antibiotic biosynthesis monooxygenase [Pseudomonas sp. FFUP_PS_473]WJM95541.1 putative quinol monooxygenase [Pseudomonas defluvii]